MVSTVASAAPLPAAPPAASSSKAETQAFLELIKNKPPANLDGLLSFINDLRRQQQQDDERHRGGGSAPVYTDREMKAMLLCPSGQVLADAIRKCEGLRRQVKKHVDDGRNQQQQAAAATPPAVVKTAAVGRGPGEEPTARLQQQRAILQQATFKYLDCLSYHVCPDRWGSYTACWTSLGNLSSADASALLQGGAGAGAGWEFLCHKERKDLERCVGQHVSNTVRHAVELQSYDDAETAASLEDDRE